MPKKIFSYKKQIKLLEDREYYENYKKKIQNKIDKINKQLKKFKR